jgi:hypothetical protein
MTRREITPAQAEWAMRNGEFDDAVRGAARNVAVLMSQDWCGQWADMDRYLDRLAGNPQAREPDLVVFQLLYNRLDSFEEFLHFKERVLGNDQIPYVRYYREGRFIGQSNYVSELQFLSFFRE